MLLTIGSKWCMKWCGCAWSEMDLWLGMDYISCDYIIYYSYSIKINIIFHDRSGM